ncbi:MAG: mycofactocin oligosaccharide methyltransferase MftM [Dermatophilaceae bacterium]
MTGSTGPPAGLARLTPLDPLGGSGGSYVDELVEVCRAVDRGPAGDARAVTSTSHFDVYRDGRRLVVVHRLAPEASDENVTTTLRRELFDPGWVRGTEMFERIFAGVVQSTDDDPAAAWECFYRNTLRRLNEIIAGPDSTACDGVIGEHAPVYRRALELALGPSSLELGSCFGFLSLLLAQRGMHGVGVDVAPGSARLLGLIARRLGLAVTGLVGDAARVPLPDRAVDTALVVHLLEHVSADHGTRVLNEAIRLSRRRVVVAVPYEQVPDETYGHVRTVTPRDLRAWGASAGLPFRVEHHHGGWLVIDCAS